MRPLLQTIPELEYDIAIMQHFDWNEIVYEIAEVAIRHYRYKTHVLADSVVIGDPIHLGNTLHLIPSHQKTKNLKSHYIFIGRYPVIRNNFLPPSMLQYHS